MSIQGKDVPVYHPIVQDFGFKINWEQLKFKHITDKQIYQFLIQTGNIGKTRDQICTELQIPRSSVYDAVNRLNLAKLVEIDFKKPKSKKGRPLTVYYLKNLRQGGNR